VSRTFISHDSGMPAPAPPPPGLPPFGSTGQLLKKISDVSYDTAWEDERVADADSIREAPIDTRMYGRQDAGWALVPHGLPAGGEDGDILYREGPVEGSAVWRPPVASTVVLPALEFHLGPFAFLADGTEAPNSTKTFTAPTAGLPTGYYCTPVAIWAMRRTADGTPTPSGSWSCELSWPDTGGGPGTFNPIGSTQNYAQVFNANRVLLYSLAGAAQPCMDPAIGSFSWRFRFTGGALLTGPFSIQTGFLGRLYPNV
jgi:hypothetical protein